MFFRCVIAGFIFIVNYSRTDPVKLVLTGNTYIGNVDRGRYYQRLLSRRKGGIYIMVLRGFLFSARLIVLLIRLWSALNSLRNPVSQFLILDFRIVVGVDSSSVSSFEKLHKIAEANNFVVRLYRRKPINSRFSCNVRICQGKRSSLSLLFAS